MHATKFSTWAAIASILLVFFTTPGSAQDVSASSTRESSITTNGKHVYRWQSSSQSTDFNIEMRGTIELTDDDRDIKSISDDGYLSISKTVFGSKRSIRIESLGDGKVKKEYYEGRSKMPWEPNGKEWLSEILPELVRTSTIGAEGRVKRLFKKGGVSAVLSEIDLLESDHVKAGYARLLMNNPVQPKDYARIVEEITGGMDSDHYITEFLKSNAQKFLQNHDATAAMFSAASRMDSDHYKTIVISEALKGDMHSAENVRTALNAAAEMESDHYISQVLLSLLNQNSLSSATLTEIINTTKSLESDHYRTMILTAALQKEGLSDEAHQQLLESVKDMSSDHYITQVIMDLMSNKLSDDTMADLLDILQSIDSDHYRTEIFKKLLEHQDLTEEQFTQLLEVNHDMDSDHYKTIVLKDAINKTSSNGELIQVLNSVDGIDSDHYVTEVLTFAAPKVKSANTETKMAYRQAAKNISSELYYGRALKAIEE